MSILRRFLCWFARCLLGLRYRVRVDGLDQLQGVQAPVLVLPNHPGYIDPMLLMSWLWPTLQPRPLVAEDTFRNPFFYPIMKLINAVAVPDMTRVGATARADASAAVGEVIRRLKLGENQIFWPSGRLQRRGFEVLGGARALTEVIRETPEAALVVVRTRGLWGSRFGFARTGKLPDFNRNLFASLGWLLASLIVFMPRRPVAITLRLVDRAELPELTREAINPWFENWYNAEGPEPPSFVPYHLFLGPKTFTYPDLAPLKEVDVSLVSPETRAAVAQVLAEKVGRTLNEAELQPDVLLDSLGLDSLGRMELTLDIERQFGHPSDDVPLNVGQVWGLAQGLMASQPPKPAPAAWFRARDDREQPHIFGDTIAAAFVERALRRPKDIAVADDMAGVLPYERMLTGVILQSRRFAKLPEPNVGLLMPTSAGGDVALLGLLMAGKLPVILNWTTGPANLAHAVRLMNVRHVVTSRVFYNRLAIEIPGVDFVFLEDLRRGMSRFEIFGTLMSVRHSPGRVRRATPAPSPDAPAVVLFTSGSEKAPKAVPLSHRNLLSNQKAGIAALKLSSGDSLLSFLPLFHSFGLSVAGLLPLLAGIRTLKHPDPRESAKLVHKIASYKPTLLLSTPTFLSHIVQRAKADDLASLRTIMVGAEKCPAALFARCRELMPGATVLEGYGITECSPIISVCRAENPRPGTVGQPLDCVQVRVVDLETGELAPAGTQGMLLVGGPSVFSGYIGGDGASPFREIDGQHFYVTGDLVEMDADRVVTFKGRLKRFVKSGGEMISLPALEEPLLQQYPNDENGPRVAVEAIEDGPRARIVLFTTEPITLVDANLLLKQAGFHGVMRFDEVRRVDPIPTLGTGKTDYKVLRAQIDAAAPKPQEVPG